VRLRVEGMSAEGDGERAKLAAEFAVFREDVVRSVAGDALLGVVEGVGGHSDSEEDDQEYEELAKGSARVSWYKKADNPATVAVDSLEVVDRALLHHDVVARKSAPLGQAGYVTAVDVKCTVRFLATGAVMEGVDSRLLQQVQPLKQVRRPWSTACGACAGRAAGVFCACRPYGGVGRARRVCAPAGAMHTLTVVPKQGTYVVYGHWLGKVDEAMDHVTVRMQDGSVCRVANADPELLVPQHDEVRPRARPRHMQPHAPLALRAAERASAIAPVGASIARENACCPVPLPPSRTFRRAVRTRKGHAQRRVQGEHFCVLRQQMAAAPAAADSD